MTKITIEFDISDNSKIEQLFDSCMKFHPTKATFSKIDEDSFRELERELSQLCIFPLGFYMSYGGW